MLDLEQMIAEWRKQMQIGGIQSAVVLDELEAHLREDLDRQMKSGQALSQAFAAAVQNIGPAVELKREFKTADASLKTRLAELAARLMELAGMAYVAIALVFSLWSLAWVFLLDTGWAAKLSGLTAVVTMIVCWSLGYKLFPIIRQPLIRALIGLAGCAGSLVWADIFFTRYVAQVVGHPQSFDLFIWGFALMAILASAGRGAGKAARRVAS